MKNLMDKKYCVLFMQGIFAQLFQAILLRELVVRFSGMELTFVAAIGSAMVWTALGCGFAAAFKFLRENHSEFKLSVFTLLSPLTAMAAFLLTVLAPPVLGGRIDTGFSCLELVVFCILAPLPFGLVNGAVFGLIVSGTSKGKSGKFYSADALGSMLGGIFFSFILSYFVAPVSILGYAGFIMVIMTCFIIINSASGFFTKSFVVLLSLSVAALMLYIVHVQEGIFSAKWKNILKGYEYEKTIETPYGRVEFLTKKSDFAIKSNTVESVIYRDGELAASLPCEYEMAYPAAMFSVLQLDRAPLKVLLIASPFSKMPNILLRIPLVGKVDFISTDKALVKVSRKLGILPPERDDFSVIAKDPRAYLEQLGDKSVYDLIMLVDSQPDTLASNRFFTEEFYRLVRKKLKEDGVFVTEISSIGGYAGTSVNIFNASLLNTLRKVFKKIVICPGESKLIAAGNENVTADFRKLDCRIEKLIPGFPDFPVGMMSIVFSQAEQISQHMDIEKYAAESLINSDSRPVLPFYYLKYKAGMLSGDMDKTEDVMNFMSWLYNSWVIVVILLISCYISIRYLMARGIIGRLSCASFENGFYAMGIELLLLFIYQNRCGCLYRDLAAAIGIFIGGTALGAWFSDEYINMRTAMMKYSFFLPFLLIPIAYIPSFSAQISIFLLLFISGLSAGAAYSEFNRRSYVNSASGLWAWEILGGTVGAVFFVFFLLPSAGFLPCVFFLALLRFPMFFLSMEFGKSAD